MASLLDQAVSVLEALAPTVATAFGGPLAGQAVQFAETALGLTPAATATMQERTDAVAAAIVNATPEQALAFRKMETDFKAHIADLGVELEKISAGDRDSARKMQAETQDWTPRILAMLLTAGYFGVLAWMLRYGIPKDGGGEALLVMLGGLSGAFTAVCAFYYGSSAGSAKKDDAIKALSR